MGHPNSGIREELRPRFGDAGLPVKVEAWPSVAVGGTSFLLADPHKMADGFAAALNAIAGPLRYASRDGFRNLDRVMDLEGTLRRAMERAVETAPTPTARELLEDIGRLLPADNAPRPFRVERLGECLAKLAALEGARPTVEPATKHRPPSPRATRGVKPLAVQDLKAGAAAKGKGNGEGVLASPPTLRPSAPSPANIDLTPDSPAQYIKGVGPRLASYLAERGIQTVEDLLRFWPRRYEDRQAHSCIRDLEVGKAATVEGEVMGRSLKRRGRRRTLEVTLADATGALDLTWFNVPAGRFADRFQSGTRFRVSGQVKRYRGMLQMTHPETTLVPAGEEPDGITDALVPVYLEVTGIRPAQIRRLITHALPAAEHLAEPIPSSLRRRRDLATLAETVTALHQPPADTDATELAALNNPWHRRLIYEELLLLQLAVLQRKTRAAEASGKAIVLGEPLVVTASSLVPFDLTGAQRRVLAQLQEDLERDVPMSRLLQGDVGSGKTVIALALAAAVARAGQQAAIMVPTELLAEQHAGVALRTLGAAGVRVELLTGAAATARRRYVLGQLATGEIQVIIGTHALIQHAVEFRSLALGIVDEQHRFGVMQRSRLMELGRQSRGCVPHMLVMTATPIPRTLALTVYGDLDVAILDELPPGRTPISTRLYRERQRSQVYQRVRRAVEQGRQAYVVFPLVEESDKDGMEQVRAATSAAEDLANGPLVGLRLGLLHGRMASDEKETIMKRFVQGDIQVLVATTVIEVGIDVANATVMVIEHAERFGLSQLHQLRGRVGRGIHASECLLVAQYTASDDAWRRLSVMETTSDGFVIAEEDLAIRGPGELVGTRQAGVLDFAMANLVRDQSLLVAAREDAREILAADPELSDPEHAGLRDLLTQQWEDRLELARIG